MPWVGRPPPPRRQTPRHAPPPPPRYGQPVGGTGMHTCFEIIISYLNINS